MRILYLVYYYFPRVSAATWSTFAITRRLARRNDVTLLTPNISFNLTLDGNTVAKYEAQNHAKTVRTPRLRMPLKLASFLSPFFLLMKGIRLGRGADIIVCQFQPNHFTFLTGLMIGKILGLPVVARANDIYREFDVPGMGPLYSLNEARKRMYNTLSEAFIGYSDAFLVVCEENRGILESRRGRLSNFGLSYNGVDLDEIRVPEKSQSRKRLGIDPDAKVILFVGRSSGPEYRIEALIDAFLLIKKSEPEAILILVGDETPPSICGSPYLAAGSIRVKGAASRDEIKLYLSASDVCVGPLGGTRAIPLKVLEYMAAGRPVVTGVDSVSREVAVDDFNCLCVAPDAEHVAAGIIKVMKDNGYRNKIVENAKKTAYEFSWDTIVGELEETLRRVIIRRSG
jgi:glycosyltransferase involved in cell wall biosynthesis